MMVMPRKTRVHFPGAVYHVTSRGNEGRPIFFKDGDRSDFLSIVSLEKTRAQSLLLAYCLISNHFHLLLHVGPMPISVIMQRILSRYSNHINSGRRVHGHLFQGRFKDSLCQDDSYLLEAVRYINLNPVRAGLASYPAQWRWSSHRCYMGECHDGLTDGGLVLS
jgi:REP element-mobilizing transposase RayT